MSGGIWIVHRDELGVPASASIVVEECTNEPPHRPWRSDDTIRTAPRLTHGLAEEVFDDGATLLCRACARARRAEEARLARLGRLAPEHRAWLAERGLDDWRPR